MDGFVETLKNAGWDVAPPVVDSGIPEHLRARHGDLPAELVAFVSSFSRCVSPCGRAWFVAASDLVRDEPFRFDAFERMSLSAADADEDWAAAIRGYWTGHFPFFLSVADTYQYFALALSGQAAGSIVYGAEPEFEECSVVASSLAEFLSMFQAAMRSPAPAFPFSAAVPRNGDLRFIHADRLCG